MVTHTSNLEFHFTNQSFSSQLEIAECRWSSLVVLSVVHLSVDVTTLQSRGSLAQLRWRIEQAPCSNVGLPDAGIACAQIDACGRDLDMLLPSTPFSSMDSSFQQ